VWYEGSGLSTPNWLHADEQGTVIATTNGSGAATQYVYSATGEPTNWSGARFRYTGQAALPEVALYYYKARMYDPHLGRFLQTDPIGYVSDYNLYAYVGNDPTNKTDPMGMIILTLGGYAEGSFIVGGNVSVGLYWDTETGEIGRYNSMEGGTGIGLSTGGTVSAYGSVGDLAGPYLTTGAGVGPASGAVVVGTNNGNHATGGNFSLGVGPVPFEHKLNAGYGWSSCWFFCGPRKNEGKLLSRPNAPQETGRASGVRLRKGLIRRH
jgi:RHS repeat-associated protein